MSKNFLTFCVVLEIIWAIALYHLSGEIRLWGSFSQETLLNAVSIGEARFVLLGLLFNCFALPFILLWQAYNSKLKKTPRFDENN